jgi:TolB-like protein
MRGARLGLFFGALGLLAAAPGLGWYFLRAGASTATPAAPAAAPAGQSIAVLPFLVMSPKHDQEYLADGVAEEILNALAQVEQVARGGAHFLFRLQGPSLKLIHAAARHTPMGSGSSRS